MNETGSGHRSLRYSAWGAAWVCFAPLGVWLVATKTMKVTYTAAVWLGSGPDYDRHGFLAPVYWTVAFGWTRFAAALLVALAFRRALAAPRFAAVRRPRSLTVGVFLLTLLALAVLRLRSEHDTIFASFCIGAARARGNFGCSSPRYGANRLQWPCSCSCSGRCSASRPLERNPSSCGVRKSWL